MNKTAWKHLAILFFISSILWSCEPCDDCGPDNAYPYFTLSILNETSLDTLKEYNTRLKNELDILDSVLSDPDNAPIVDSLNSQRKITSDSLLLINALIATTEDRFISIESINGETNLFENKNGGDSLSRFKIPINTLQAESNYSFKIEFADTVRQLKIQYQLIDTAINDKITKAAKNFQVIEHNFVSLRGPFGCTPRSECISNELEIYVEI